ncbi:Uncharacterized protein FKW44_017581 [Caligus rogercresseyi]|uniref:Uncharacterized protein n=1 Tax=Caligus rogercresseyi TaxID=217165 RepID=A0A7T8GT60_CALRO|nr:Uncharacterized protein FKW44_017581 [Caligus rogercresseyi]
MRYARSSVERLDRDLKDLTGKLERAQDGSFLSECYLPSFYERYKELLSRRNELSELLASRGRYSTEETREEDMSPSSASLFSDLEKNKVYKASVTHTADNGLTVNVIDEESRVAITGIFIPNAWVSKKSAENAEAGVELSLQFRGVDPISGVPRLVESHSLKRRAAPSDHNDIPFKTFKPTELFKLDVWSSSNLICSKFQGFLFEVSKMRSLRKTSEFFDHFRAQIRYCKDLNRLVSGPLSKTITLEIQEETKDIYTDMVYVMNLLRELHNESTTGFTLAKELSHFVESPGINDIDEDTDEPVMFSNFTHSYKIMEEHFASVVCDRSRIPGQILLDFEKRNLEEAIRVDREKIGQCLVCIIDSYCGFLRRNYLEFLNDWIDYDCLPPFAFHCSEIYETIKDDKDVEAIEDVRLFLHVINNIPPENTTFIMRQWISEELKSHLVPLCREYIECYEALMEQRRQWWNNQNALSIDEATLQEKYDYIIKWKNSMKEASMEVRFFEELLRIMPLSINYSDLVELNSLIRRSSQGDESAVSDLRVALGTFRNNLKAAITQQFTKK